MVPWYGLWPVILTFPGHTFLLLVDCNRHKLLGNCCKMDKFDVQIANRLFLAENNSLNNCLSQYIPVSVKKRATIGPPAKRHLWRFPGGPMVAQDSMLAGYSYLPVLTCNQ